MANTGKVVVYDRRCIEVSRCVATVGPCFVVSFHPTYSDLLAVCYRKTKTKTNSRVQFFQLVGSSVSVGTPQSSAGVSDNNYGSCELFLGGVNAATPIAEQNLISPIDTVDPLNRLRWRPAVVPVASEAATVDSHNAIVDKISSQLWFATTSLSGQEVSVWDGSNVYCPIFSIKSVCEGRSATRRERTLREPTDCVWVNAVTLVTVFKDGEVGLTSLLDEPTESKETLFRCGTDSALEKASTCGSCALMAGFSGMFSLAAILPTSAVLPDFFGHCLLVRNTSSALREHYTNIIQSDKTKVLDQLLVENSGEDDGVTAASVTTLSTPAWSSIAASPVPAAGTAAPVRVARESVRATPTGLTPAEVGRPHSPKVPLRQSQARASQSSSVVAVSCVAGSTAVSSAPLTSKCPELLFPLLMSFTSHTHVAGIPSEQPPLTEGTTLKNGESMGAWHTQERQHEDPNKIPPHSSISFSVRRGNISSSDSGCDASHEAGTAENTRAGYRQLSGTARSGTRKGQFSLLVPPTFGVVPGEASEKLLPMALQPHHAGTVSPFSLMGSGSDSSTFVQSNTLPATCSHVNSDWGSSPLTDIQSARRAVQGLVDPSINSRSTGAPPAPVEAAPPTTLPTSSSARLPPLGNKSFVNPIIERLNISASVPGTAYVEQSHECGAFVRYAMGWDVGYDVACQMRSRRSAAATSEEYADIDGEDEEMELANARRADKCFTKIMAHNAKVCFAHASRTSGQTDAQCGKEPAPGGRGIEGDSDRTRLDTTTNSPFDIRGRLWASAREMWRNRDTLNTASHVATLLDYGSQVGDVQFCAVLYLLFCLWWKQRHRNLRRHPCPLLLSYDTAVMEEHCATTRAGAPQISGCTPQRWRLRALQWVEQYVSRLYVMRLYVPINELQLVVPEVLGDSNPVLPRTEEIAQKLFTCVYCGSCRKRELVPHHTTRKRQVSQGCSSVEQLPQGKRSEHSSDMCMSTCSSSEDSESLSSCCLSFCSPCVLGGDGVNTCGTNSGAAAVCDWSGANEVLHNNNNNGGSGIVTTETCGAVTSRNAVCRSCGSQSLMTCVICEEVVEGMFMWLRCCGHGGHVQHIQEWLSVANECPACGVPVTMKE
ncbi:unnamed protein product [Trypanosoma congolense IL3000]|uniref:WGS project CAEQ00000000 data, annotated contig 1602 n=1 Tax=Trypanosoma congolense (strain IL3000) TaxID=1068625 RepID=F9W7F7_TRYCI|nr:unnamed protein product [Trypanosoma congolense IL3000]